MFIFRVLSRRHTIVGEKKQRLTVVVESMGIELNRLESSPYGLTDGDVIKLTEEYLKNHRSALSIYGVNSSVERKNF